MYSSMWSAIFLTAVIVILSILIWTKSIKKALQPIYDLMMITEKFSQGDFSQRALQCKTDEVGKLGSAFNRMADELNVLINNLEQIIELKRGFLSKIFPKPKNLFSINK